MLDYFVSHYFITPKPLIKKCCNFLHILNGEKCVQSPSVTMWSVELHLCYFFYPKKKYKIIFIIHLHGVPTMVHQVKNLAFFMQQCQFDSWPGAGG